MALILRTPDEAAVFTQHVRQNMVRENLPSPFHARIRRQRGLRVAEDEGLEPIDRGPEVIGPGGVVGGGDGVVSSVTSCLAAMSGGGMMFNLNQATPAIEFVGQSSNRIPSPFILTTIGFISTVARNSSILFLVEVSDNEDITAIPGGVFPRSSIHGQFSTGQNIFPTNAHEFFFPNHHEPASGRFIKLWLFNNSVGAVNVSVGISFTLL